MSNSTPQIRFKGYTHAWEKRKLGEITTKIGSGKTPKGGSAVYLQEGIPLLRSQNIVNDRVDSSDVAYISDSVDKEMANSRVQANDILLNITGASIGRSAVYENSSPANVNQHVCIIRPQSEFNSNFIQLNLTSPNGQQQIDSNQAGGGREGLNFQQIAKIVFNYPTLPEQTAIGSFFATLDNTITLYKQKLDGLRTLKKGYLQQMFPQAGENVPRVRFDGFSGEWVERKLGEIGSTFTGLSGKTKEDFGHGNAQFVTYLNVFSNAIANIGQTERVEIDSKQSEVQYGDVLFTTSSETPEEIGMSSVWLDNRANVYLNSFCFGYRPQNSFDPYFLAFLFRSPKIRQHFTLLAQGISRYNISKTKTMEMPILFPTIDEQQKIGSFFRNLDEQIMAQQTKVEQIQQLKKSYLQKMFI